MEREAGKNPTRMRPADFAKWMASVVGWFEYLGRSTLGEFQDNAAEIADGTEKAATMLSSLPATLKNLEEWASWR
jgi:hypothetical protein